MTAEGLGVKSVGVGKKIYRIMDFSRVVQIFEKKRYSLLVHLSGRIHTSSG